MKKMKNKSQFPTTKPRILCNINNKVELLLSVTITIINKSNLANTSCVVTVHTSVFTLSRETLFRSL